MPYKVYLSDTSSELEALRPILIAQIRLWGMIPLEMTGEDRKKPDMEEIVRRKISEADYFISILTYKRAWEPDDMGGKSLAEIEYDLVREMNKPFAILVPEQSSDLAMYLRRWTLDQTEDERQSQKAFHNRVKEGGSLVYFHDEADLPRQIMDILSSWATAQSGGGLLAQAAVPLTPEKVQRFFPEPGALDIDALADRVAEKVAVKVVDIQGKRQEELAEQAIKVKEALQLQPGELVFGKPSPRSQFRSDVFMIMPFAAEFDSIYRGIIVPLMGELGLTVQRGDDFVSTQGIIMEEVWSALNACRFVIVEITGGNDNVFYELGIAHTLNKPAILISQADSPDSVPFNIRHLRRIEYQNTVSGGEKLREDLRRSIGRLVADLEEGWG